MRNEFLLRSVKALDVAGVKTGLTALRADRTYQPLPTGMNPLHVVLAHVPKVCVCIVWALPVQN